MSSGGTTYALVQRTFDLRGRLECEARRMNPAAFPGSGSGAGSSLPASACALGTEGSFGPDRIGRMVWDAANQLTQEQRAVGTPLQQNYATYTYTLNGQRRGVTDANGNRAELRYDGHDRLVRWVFPSRTTPGALNEADYELYGYDAAGNRTSLRRRDGKTITFLYDNLNRVTRKTVPASASGAAGYSVFYGYDIGNRQTFARFGSTSPSQPGITSTYDSLGRLVSSANSMGGTTRTLTYQVDAGGRRTRLTFPDGQYFTYEHSPAGELTAIRENGGTAVATFSYDAVSRPSAQAFPGASAAFQYDPIWRLASLTHDLAGTGADNAATFAYNSASQIVIRTGSNDAYAAASQPDVTRAYSVNGLNQYTAVAGTPFAYDNNGNLSSDGGSTYVYDSENRLVSAGGGSSATLSYDPMGRLFQTVGGGVTTRFLYDGDELVAEYDGASNLLRRYVHGLGVDDPVLWYEGAAVSSSNRRSLHRNHQGSIVAVADNNGAAIAINAYDPWGIPNAGNLGRFGYTGQIWLPEIGMWYYKARVYSPTLGRFLQTDPVGYEDQMNLYAYVGNDPVNLTDVSGMCKTDPNTGIETGICGTGTYEKEFVDQMLADPNSDFSEVEAAAIASGNRIGLTFVVNDNSIDGFGTEEGQNPGDSNVFIDVGETIRIDNLDADGNVTSSRFISLQEGAEHEVVGHAYDAIRNPNQIRTRDMADERNAIDRENAYRQRAGIPFRRNYSPFSRGVKCNSRRQCSQ